MVIERAGFFKELRHGEPTGPSLVSAVGRLQAADPEVVAHYLEKGTTLSATGTVVDDALEPANRAVAALEVATDGRWIWPRDLAYYVHVYQVEVPQALLDIIAVSGGSPPVLTHDELVRVEDELFG